MKRIRTGDEVIVIAGKADNKGRRGRVSSVDDEYVVVEGVNFIVRHVKPNQQLQTEGQMVRKEAPIHISNVMIYNAEIGRGDRVGFKVEEGKKIRFYKSTGMKID